MILRQLIDGCISRRRAKKRREAHKENSRDFQDPVLCQRLREAKTLRDRLKIVRISIQARYFQNPRVRSGIAEHRSNIRKIIASLLRKGKTDALMARDVKTLSLEETRKVITGKFNMRDAEISFVSVTIIRAQVVAQSRRQFKLHLPEILTIIDSNIITILGRILAEVRY